MILDLIFPKKCLECGRSGTYICPMCLKKVRPGVSNGGHLSLWKYEGVIRRAIIALKYKFATDVANELSGACIKKIKKSKIFRKKFVLVPIPLHKKRKNVRGFNQVEIIGEKISKELGWKIVPDLLIRTKPTLPQVELRGAERRSNLSRVFEVNKQGLKNINSKILLFDDVFTTGSTIKEVGKALGKGGYKNIKSLSIAR